MDLKRIADKAKDLVDKRGGTDSLKEDAGELKEIAGGQGSITDKAKEAFEAIKDPGDQAEPGAGPEAAARPQQPAPGEPAERADRGRTGGRRRRRQGARGRGRDV